MTIDPMAVLPTWYKQASALRFLPAPSGETLLGFDPAVPGPSSFKYWEPRPAYPPHGRIVMVMRGEAKGLTAPAFAGLCVSKYNFEDIVNQEYSAAILEDGPWERRVEIRNGIYQFVTPLFERRGGGGLWVREIALAYGPD
jgi:hypothetical protein